MADAAILDFRNSQILLAERFGGPSCITMPNFVKIRKSVAELLQFFHFKDGGHPPSWICLGHNLDDPRNVLYGLHHCAKFGCDRRQGWNKLWDREGGCPQISMQRARLDLCTPPLSDGVTVYGATEIRWPTNLSAGQHGDWIVDRLHLNNFLSDRSSADLIVRSQLGRGKKVMCPQ